MRQFFPKFWNDDYVIRDDVIGYPAKATDSSWPYEQSGISSFYELGDRKSRISLMKVPLIGSKSLSQTVTNKAFAWLSHLGCNFPMVVVYVLPHTEFGRNDYREDAPHFTWSYQSGSKYLTPYSSIRGGCFLFRIRLSRRFLTCWDPLFIPVFEKSYFQMFL